MRSLALLCVFGCAATATDPHAPHAPHARAGELASRFAARRVVMGFVVGTIAPDGTERIRGYGRVATNTKERPGPDTVFEVGSLSKVFTGVLLAGMARDGLVRLDQPVADLLPGRVRVPRAITLVHLSTHASGLPYMPGNFAPADRSRPYADYSVERLYAFLDRYRPPRPPGEAYEYSNLGAGLLGHALARRAGTAYGELLAARVTGPLGMEATTVRRPAVVAQGHDVDRRPVPGWEVPTLIGALGAYSTAGDMMRFARANLGDDPVLAAARRVRYRREGRTVCLGWHVAADDSRWHHGETGGFRAYLAVHAERGAGVVVLANTNHEAVELLGGRIMAALLGDEDGE